MEANTFCKHNSCVFHTKPCAENCWNCWVTGKDKKLKPRNKMDTNTDIEHVVQIRYISKDAAELTKLHLTELGYECEVVKMVV